jgi:hypothetical protein
MKRKTKQKKEEELINRKSWKALKKIVNQISSINFSHTFHAELNLNKLWKRQ